MRASRGCAVVDRLEVSNRAKLYWRCRRGTRELDLLLQGFLDTEYDRSPPAEQQAFASLLSYQDPELIDYLFGNSLPDDIQVADLVLKIRQ